MAKSTTVATNLVGQRVRITLGQPETEYWTYDRARDPSNRYTGWQYLGWYGIVRAVYQGADKELWASVELAGNFSKEDGSLKEVYTKHLKTVVVSHFEAMEKLDKYHRENEGIQHCSVPQLVTILQTDAYPREKFGAATQQELTPYVEAWLAQKGAKQ